MKPTLLAIALAMAGALAGCSQQELYGQLSERQANEMVAVLRDAGMAADKTAHENGQFALATSNADFSRAIGLLHAAGYPRSEFDTLGQVFKKEGFVSTPTEERARLIHALSQEMASTLNNIDGVVVARVHLAVPEREPLADKPRPAAASVFIKHRAGIDLTPQLGHIKALVVNAVDGLPYDNVTVVLFAAAPWPAAHSPARAAQASALGGLDTPLVAVASLGGAALLAGAGLSWWQRRRAPTRSVTLTGASTGTGTGTHVDAEPVRRP
jgi:type III secretion protein J